MRPEKIVNPYGSTAGANSGDFHLYRQTRAREMERMKQLTEEEKERMRDMEFEKKIQEDREEEQKKTEKKRKKRQKQKEAKLRRKMLAKAGVELDGGDEDEVEGDYDDFAVPSPEETKEAEPFSFAEPEKGDTTIDSAEGVESANDKDGTVTSIPAPPFPNDGSFLEMMKKKLEANDGDKE